MYRLPVPARRFAATLLTGLMALTLPGCRSRESFISGDTERPGMNDDAKPPPFVFQRITMGTRTRILIDTDSRADAETAARIGFARIAALEDVLSDWRPASETSRLTPAAFDAPVAVSRDLADVLARSIEVHDLTDGLFDPALGHITHAWRKQRANMNQDEDRGENDDAMETPEAALASELRGRLEVDSVADGRATVRFHDRRVRLDFGGIGKGYAAHAARNAIRDAGWPSCLVAIGGDIACGEAPRRSPRGWRINAGVQQPLRLLLANASISTSGDAEQSIHVDGIPSAHIIDPATGRGASTTRSVSVVALHGGDADAFASAFFLCGPTTTTRFVDAMEGDKVFWIRFEEANGNAPIVQSNAILPITFPTDSPAGPASTREE